MCMWESAAKTNYRQEVKASTIIDFHWKNPNTVSAQPHLARLFCELLPCFFFGVMKQRYGQPFTPIQNDLLNLKFKWQLLIAGCSVWSKRSVFLHVGLRYSPCLVASAVLAGDISNMCTHIFWGCSKVFIFQVSSILSFSFIHQL